MRRMAMAGSAILGLSIAACGAASESAGAESAAAQQAPERVEQRVEQVLATWPEESAEVAREAVGLYGTPAEVAEGRLVWQDVGEWKRVVAYREVVHHNFPMPHIDVLEGFIDYRVPPERMDDLARFTGSVYVDRTRGEISAKCDKEGANFLSLNLAHRIVNDDISVEEARRFYAEAIEAKMAGNPPPETEGFQFPVPRGDTADPDEAVMDGSS